MAIPCLVVLGVVSCLAGPASPPDAGDSGDIAVVDANGRCRDLDEASCVANRQRCHPIRGQSYASVCARQTLSEFFGCVDGGPDGGAAITWGLDPVTGRRAQFASTQLPESWERIEPPACGADAGSDSPVDS